MKLTYFANWKSCLRTLVLTMMVIVAVLAVKPATVQAKALIIHRIQKDGLKLVRKSEET